MGPLRLCVVGLTFFAVKVPEAASSGLPAAALKGGAPAKRHAARTDRQGDDLPPRAVARLGTLRLRQAESVLWVTLSPDGKTVASSTYEGTVRLWDAATGKERLSLVKQDGIIFQVAFSPDGKLLAWSGSGKMRLWDLATGKQAQMDCYDPHTSALAFSPDGKILAAGGPWGVLGHVSGEVVLGDVAKRELLHKLEVKDGPVHALAFSPDGKTLAVGSGPDGSTPSSIGLWDVATGKLVGRLQGHQGAVTCVAFSVNGKLLGSGGYDHTLRLWDLAACKELRRFPKLALALAFSPHGKILAWGGMDGAIHLWDPATGKEMRRLPDAPSHVASIGFSRDGKRLVAGGGDGSIALWDLATAEPIPPGPGHRHYVWSVAFSADGRKVASLSRDGTVRVWDAQTAEQLHRLDAGPPNEWPWARRSVAFSPDSKLLAARSGKKTTPLLCDATTGKKLSTLEDHRGAADGLDFSPDGEALAVCLWYEGIQLWSTVTGKRLRLLDFQPGVRRARRTARDLCVAFSPDGRTLAAGCNEQVIHFWDWTTGEQLGEIEAHAHDVVGLAYSPDGKMLASCGGRLQDLPDETIRLWEVASRKLIHKLRGHKGAVPSVAISPDGMTIASAGQDDNTVRLWNAFTGKELAQLQGHTGGVNAVAFSPDGNLLASGSADTTVLLWDLRGLQARPEATNPAREELNALWKDLAGAHLGKAYRAAWRLLGAKDRGVALLRDHTKPVPVPDDKLVQRLIRDLDAQRFATREAASRELARLGNIVEPSLRAALARKPPPETRRRLKDILAELKAPAPDALAVAASRAVQVLECIESPDAREVLQALAAGAPGASVTRHAKAALQRLKRHPLRR